MYKLTENKAAMNFRINTRETYIYISCGILPLTAITNPRVINVLLLFSGLLILRIIQSKFKLYISKQSREMIIGIFLFAAPAIGVFFNDYTDISLKEGIEYGSKNLILSSTIAIIFVLISNVKYNIQLIKKSFYIFISSFLLIALFILIILSTKQYNLSQIYYLVNNQESLEINYPFLGPVAGGAFWEILSAPTFFLLYSFYFTRLRLSTFLYFILSSLFLLSIGSRGCLFIYIVNFFLLIYTKLKFECKSRKKIFTVAIVSLGFLPFVYQVVTTSIGNLSIFQRFEGSEDKLLESGRFDLWADFFSNLDKIYLFNADLNTNLGGKFSFSFHNYVMDAALMSGLVGMVISLCAMVFIFRCCKTFLTKVLVITIIICKMFAFPPFAAVSTYNIALCIIPLLDQLYNSNMKDLLDKSNSYE